jgi:hypothetical protein
MLSSFGKFILSVGLISMDCLNAKEPVSGPFQHPKLVARSAALTAETAAFATAAASAIFLGTSFVDVQRSTVQVSAIQFGDGSIGLRAIAHLDEPKTSGLTRVAVRDEVYTLNAAVGFEHGSNRIFGCSET